MLEFDFPETKIIIKDKKVVDIKKYNLYDSNNLIEEFMIITNQVI